MNLYIRIKLWIFPQGMKVIINKYVYKIKQDDNDQIKCYHIGLMVKDKYIHMLKKYKIDFNKYFPWWYDLQQSEYY